MLKLTAYNRITKNTKIVKHTAVLPDYSVTVAFETTLCKLMCVNCKVLNNVT